ncbi:MAG: hypothetical protein R3E56_03730 [Burkholderiaceae bacterium]
MSDRLGGNAWVWETTIGKQLAKRYHLEFYIRMREVEGREGCSISPFSKV